MPGEVVALLHGFLPTDGAARGEPAIEERCFPLHSGMPRHAAVTIAAYHLDFQMDMP